MATPSKEEQLLNLILGNSPLKIWHFEEFVKQTNMTRASINKWLKKYQKDGLLKRIKDKGKFPYFTANSNNTVYQSKKKIFMLNKLHEVGFINHLLSLEKAKTIIIFGSIAKGDWYNDSDIDIFILGDAKGIKKSKYEIQLHRDIELHIFESKKNVKAVKTGLINNVINGFIIKGNIQEFAKVS
jgi:predicted nucleotidyltransferase